MKTFELRQQCSTDVLLTHAFRPTDKQPWSIDSGAFKLWDTISSKFLLSCSPLELTSLQVFLFETVLIVSVVKQCFLQRCSWFLLRYDLVDDTRDSLKRVT